MRTVYVVPHTHWDREWYQPLELFRWRLVRMVDELIDHMERFPEYRCFNLDGQSIVIADYLEVRPENAARLRTLVQEGRILIGPWWVQPDEFLPSGESHIRSFQRGIRFAERLGGSLRIGHCADQFGHIAQMPQIMAGLGLTSACLWRGVPDSVPGWSFRWQAPDGTELPVLYLRQSYSNGWRLPADAGELHARAREAERKRRDDEPALLMNGTDHSRMEKHVPAAITAACDQEHHFRLATLPEYETALLAAGVDDHVHAGELRSPDRSNVLVGVLSARMNLKQRDFEVDGWLTRYAEPLELLSWLHGGPDGMPGLRHAWGIALENTPHDSICGCSIDQTHLEMLPRYDRAEQIARQIARESMGHLITHLSTPASGALAVFRPVAHAPAVLEVEVPGDWEAPGIAVPPSAGVAVALGPAGPAEILADADLTPEQAVRHLAFLREGRYDVHAIEAIRSRVEERHLVIETSVGDALNVIDETAPRETVAAALREGNVDSARVTVTLSPRRVLRAVLPPTDAVGVEAWEPADMPATNDRPEAGRRTIRNAWYTVRLDGRGRLSIEDRRTGLRIENAATFLSEGDRGDEYNADILSDAVVQPAAVDTLACRADAVSATLTYQVTLAVPTRLRRRRHRRTRRHVALPILVQVRLWSGLRRVDFHALVDNTAEDHRLRVLFPLPFAVDTAITENQFHVAARSLDIPDWNGTSAEVPPTTFPQKTFVAFEAASDDSGDAGAGLALFNRGLPEGEVVHDADGRQAYALTLLRCVGWLSRSDLSCRTGGAGPMIRTPAAQMRGTHLFNFALTTYAGSWSDAGIQPMAHAYAYPPVAWSTNAHAGDFACRIPLARIADPAVVPSALHRSHADGSAIARVYNASGEARTAELGIPRAGPGANRVDLLERHAWEVYAVDAGWRLDLRPWEIATVRFGRR